MKILVQMLLNFPARRALVGVLAFAFLAGALGCDPSTAPARKTEARAHSESSDVSSEDSEPKSDAESGGALSVGAEAPAFELKNLRGETVSLRSYRGKAVLLNFWATWCAPCVAEMPSLVRLSKELKDKGVELLSINVDGAKKRDEVLRFAQENGMDFQVLLDPTFSVPPLYAVSGFPETMLIDPSGTFLEVLDPAQRKKVVKFLGDRPWDAPAFRDALLEALRR